MAGRRTPIRRYSPWDPEFDLFFVSEPSSRRARNVAGDMRLTGDCAVAREEDVAVAAFTAYSMRFPSFGRDPALRGSRLAGTAASNLYRFRVSSLTPTDEPRLGRRNYPNLDVVR